MIKSRRHYSQRQLAFTLMEIMVVVSIVAIIGAVTAISLAHSQDTAKLQQCEANVQSIVNNLYNFKNTNLFFPDTNGPQTASDLRASSDIEDEVTHSTTPWGTIVPDIHCPCVDSSSYGSEQGEYIIDSSSEADTFTVYCGSASHTHRNLPANHPVYRGSEQKMYPFDRNGETQFYVWPTSSDE